MTAWVLGPAGATAAAGNAGLGAARPAGVKPFRLRLGLD